MMSLYSHKTFISKKAVPIFGGTEILYELELCLGGMFVRTFALRRKLRAISAKLLSVSSRLHNKVFSLFEILLSFVRL